MVNVEDHLVQALVALDVERAHAVLPHVIETHLLNRIIEARAGHHQRASRAAWADRRGNEQYKKIECKYFGTSG